MQNASAFLRRTIVVDAVISGTTGLLTFLAASTLEHLLGVPAAFLRIVGILLLPFAALLAYLSTRHQLPRAAVVAVIAANAAWVVASAMVLVTKQIEPNALGYAFVIIQAVAVTGFAKLQYMGLRKASTAGSKPGVQLC